LIITAVDTADGRFAAFDRTSGVRLLDAVSASCAVPTVWPPISVNGGRYMDGGMRSPTNADAATGYDRVLVIAPVAGFPGSPLGPSLEEEVATLRQNADVHVVLADQRAADAFGTNPLAPATRVPSALAGRAQSEDVLAAVAAFWP
jgi:NTE family protein